VIVIPAEAGIQKIRDWIPIFMGMTEISVIRDIRGKNILRRLNKKRRATYDPRKINDPFN